jgi:hypothetical protein
MDRNGGVWWGPAPDRSDPAYRLWAIINTPDHPFCHTECISLGTTTHRHESAIPTPEEAWVQGGLEKRSYIFQETLTAEIVAEPATQLYTHTPVGG